MKMMKYGNILVEIESLLDVLDMGVCSKIEREYILAEVERLYASLREAEIPTKVLELV